MRNLAVIGGQWGDEGKGKVIDFLGARFSIVARFQGGHNAGHSVQVGDVRYALRLVPSGIIRKDTRCVIGNGVVVDPRALLSEIRELEGRGVRVKGRLFVSDRAHVIFPFHQIFDAARENEAGVKKLGTTLRGIGPTYLSKAGRFGLRMSDLIQPKGLADALARTLAVWNRVLAGGYGQADIDPTSLYRDYSKLGRLLRPYVTDTSQLLARAMDRGQALLFEGAQGTLLDVDHGTYPFVTSSSATAGGVAPGLGIPPRAVHGVIGIFKAYSTRVGSGPFPTEEIGEPGQRLRERGKEYGTVTGRPRRCGWFDGVAARHAQRVCGFDAVAVTLFDVLDAFARIPVAVAYRYKGSLMREFPADVRVLEKVTPVYRMARGWMTSTRGIADVRQLPQLAKDYVRRLEDLVGAPALLISTGPARNEIIVTDRDALARLLPPDRHRPGRRARGARP